ncbi:WG repeat-containing protein, partial [Psychrobacter sp. AOP31-A1-22]
MNYDNILWLVTKPKGTSVLDKTYGFVNNQGEVVIPLKFDYAEGFVNGVSSVSLNSQWGLIDTTGYLVIPNQYEHVSGFSDGLARASIYDSDSRYGFLNAYNKIVIPFEYSYAEDFHDGYAIVGRDGKTGVIDKNNNIVVPMKRYDYIFHTDSHEPETEDWQFRVGTYNPPRVDILNSKGERVFPIYQITGFFKEGLINVKKDGKWGYVDSDNKTKIDFIYDEALQFYDNKALVFKGGKAGFINSKGDVITPIEYDHIGIFDINNGAEFMSARKGDIYYLIDRQGNEVQTDYDKIDSFMVGLAPVMKANPNSPTGEYYGVINDKGELIIPLKYPFLTVEYGGQYHGLIKAVTDDGRHYVLDRDGTIIADKT